MIDQHEKEKERKHETDKIELDYRKKKEEHMKLEDEKKR